MHCETISVSAALSFPICALLPWPFICSSLGLNLLLTVSDSFKLNFGTSRDDLIDCTGFRISTAASDSILADAILVLCLMVTLPSSAKGMLSCEDVEPCWFLRGLMFSPAGFFSTTLPFIRWRFTSGPPTVFHIFWRDGWGHGFKNRAVTCLIWASCIVLQPSCNASDTSCALHFNPTCSYPTRGRA